MRIAVIGGTGVYGMEGGTFSEKIISTPFGEALTFLGTGDLEHVVFLARHGPEHNIPPHRVNYRANLYALYQLGVERIMATYAVGSLNLSIPPGGMVALDQMIDMTHGRDFTFFDGGEYGLAHTDFTYPYCPALRKNLLSLAPKYDLEMQSTGTYIAFNGPRLETAAEIQYFASMGGDVVSMTGAPEAQLARELSMHFAGVATSINYAAGLKKGQTAMDTSGLKAKLGKLLNLFLDSMNDPLEETCDCETSVRVTHKPTAWQLRQA